MSKSVADLIDKIVQYLELKAEQIKLKVIGKLSKVLSNALSLGIVIVLSFFFLFFLSFVLSMLFNEILRSSYLGFLIITGFYLILIILILILVKRGVIQNWLENLLLNINETKDDNESN